METEQLAALARIHHLFERNAIEYWLFGGWAVDFYAGSVTRPHDDLELAVWRDEHTRIQWPDRAFEDDRRELLGVQPG
jgi:hypothetical protein